MCIRLFLNRFVFKKRYFFHFSERSISFDFRSFFSEQHPFPRKISFVFKNVSSTKLCPSLITSGIRVFKCRKGGGLSSFISWDVKLKEGLVGNSGGYIEFSYLCVQLAVLIQLFTNNAILQVRTEPSYINQIQSTLSGIVDGL